MYLSSVPDYILGLFKSGELVYSSFCENVPSLSFAPVFVSFDLEQLVASEPVLSFCEMGRMVIPVLQGG